MADIQVVANISEALLTRAHPAITRWNRLEGRPRTHHFDRALRAEVRDAIWMLSRQWQMGEFVGDDAGSPILARACLDFRLLDHYQPDAGAVQPLDAEDVLEARVERRAVPMAVNGQYLSLDLRMSVGRRWLRLLQRDFPATDYPDQFRDAYAVKVPDPTDPADRLVCAHMDAWQEVGCAAERAIDGVALLEHVAGGGAVTDGIVLAQPAHAAAPGRAARPSTGLVRRLIDQPQAGDDAWQPERLEYAFGVSAPSGDSDDGGGTDVVLRGARVRPRQPRLVRARAQRRDTARSGRGRAGVAPTRSVQTFIPTQVVFDGMPNTRWWAFEDRRTNFGEVAPDTTDVGKLMLMEFALIFANDWFVFRGRCRSAGLARVQGIALSTVFDERLWIEPVTQGVATDGWESWSMFSLTGDSAGHSTFPSELAILPVAPKVLEGESLEDLSLCGTRWPTWSGRSSIRCRCRPGGLARATRPRTSCTPSCRDWSGHWAAAARAGGARSATRGDDEASPRSGSAFIPVARLRQHAGDAAPACGDAALPRQRAAAAGTVSSRARRCCDRTSGRVLHPRGRGAASGCRVTQCLQRARRLDGTVLVWYGVCKATGRGEGSSRTRRLDGDHSDDTSDTSRDAKSMWY